MTVTSFVLFNMVSVNREWFIASHNFYLEQAQKRLLSQFSNIDQEASKAGSDWIARNEKFFDPENSDPDRFYDSASSYAEDFHYLLTDMERQTRLGVAAGMFHQWDKQFRNWAHKETLFWHTGEHLKKAIWRADFKQLFNILAPLGWDVTAQTFYADLNKCRLLVNAYKHGEGGSFEEIKEKYPEYLINPKSKYVTYDDLTLTAAQLESFSEAIQSFWKDFPERIEYNNGAISMPKWFEDALRLDKNVSGKVAS